MLRPLHRLLSSTASASPAPALSLARPLRKHSILPRSPNTHPPSSQQQLLTPRLPIPPGFVGKLKHPTKRAKALLNQIESELLKTAPKRPDIKPGDSLEIVFRESRTVNKPKTLTGVCVGIDKPNSWAAALRVLSIVDDSRIHYVFPLNAPWITNIRLLQEAFIHKGTRRVRRSKLYYIDGWPINKVRVAPSKETMAERARFVAQRVAEAKEKKAEATRKASAAKRAAAEKKSPA